jgi:hypothetical protein
MVTPTCLASLSGPKITISYHDLRPTTPRAQAIKRMTTPLRGARLIISWAQRLSKTASLHLNIQHKKQM